ncbi:unnamed protein product [Nippostrongylus brasiliensis]|uniref:Transmembrane protein 26 (inferred by orthology to a human protein) n=1 Tax=Nippostrongylus brasiliensis TaxID=27835 RepID=A0A0N4YII2_NIPBR|nr:unnamed protein product [Nippostrongylus brasiliensis]
MLISLVVPFRAILARLLFIIHSLTTIWHTVGIEGSPIPQVYSYRNTCLTSTYVVCPSGKLTHSSDGVWGFALLSLLIVFEGSYTIIMRAGDERKWFCTSLLLYIVATAPPIWLLETKMCEWRREFELLGESKIRIGGPEEELHLQLLEQLLLVTLIVGRWFLTSRTPTFGQNDRVEHKSFFFYVLVFKAISSDIVEFFDVFKEKHVYNHVNVQQIVLAAWTLSLLQFPFVLTVSRARKMRVAITKTYEELILPRSPPNIWEIIYDVDIWAIILANSLQDIPFLLVRLYLMLQHGLVTYTMIFFTCKNALIIALQTYRAFILLNDRYIRPKPPDFDMLEAHHVHHAREHTRKPPSHHHRKKKARRDKSEERGRLLSPRRDRSRHRMDTVEETTA